MSLVEDIRERARHSVLLRMLFMGFLILVLQIPILIAGSTLPSPPADLPASWTPEMPALQAIGRRA